MVDIDPELVQAFSRDGHVCVRGLIPPELVESARPAIEAAAAERTKHVLPLEERNTYGKAFLQATNLWKLDEGVRRFVFARRFAGAAAALLGVDGVRLYHDQALIKEAGGGPTPWHQDQRYWPLDTTHTITMWMPLASAALSHTSPFGNVFIGGIGYGAPAGRHFSSALASPETPTSAATLS